MTESKRDFNYQPCPLNLDLLTLGDSFCMSWGEHQATLGCCRWLIAFQQPTAYFIVPVCNHHDVLQLQTKNPNFQLFPVEVGTASDHQGIVYDNYYALANCGSWIQPAQITATERETPLDAEPVRQLIRSWVQGTATQDNQLLY